MRLVTVFALGLSVAVALPDSARAAVSPETAPPGATVTLAPGGLHLMLMGLRKPLVRDTLVPLTLVFEKAGSVEIELSVEAMGAQRRTHGS